MKPMIEYLEAANDLLSSVWGDAKTAEVRGFLTRNYAHWSVAEQEDLLTLCASLAFWQVEGAREAGWEATRRAREVEDAARKTSKGIGRFRLRESDKRETEHRQAVIERHFGAALRGEVSIEDDVPKSSKGSAGQEGEAA